MRKASTGVPSSNLIIIHCFGFLRRFHSTNNKVEADTKNSAVDQGELSPEIKR